MPEKNPAKSLPNTADAVKFYIPGLSGNFVIYVGHSKKILIQINTIVLATCPPLQGLRNMSVVRLKINVNIVCLRLHDSSLADIGCVDFIALKNFRRYVKEDGVIELIIFAISVIYYVRPYNIC
jgi:hypothetical protein